MRKLPEVEEARSIMTQGMEWGVWKWITEKKRVRVVADQATDALNAAEMKVKEAWPEELKLAYDAVVDGEFSKGKKRKASSGNGVNADLVKLAREVREADVVAEQCRLDAEDTFAEADRKMSTELARQGARKALERYDLHEKAIRRAEAAGRGK
jgi:hypothetical protein